MSQKFLYAKHGPDDPTRPVQIGSAVFGGADVPVIAGPCSVESLEQLEEIAQTLKALGIVCMRGGAYKPRTSPYGFQGLGEPALDMLAQIRRKYDLAIITEVMTLEQIGPMHDRIDCYQVGSRNMQNFDLLKALGRQQKPVVLKRGLSATLQEFLYAAEYILAGGNPNVILCERGIRSYEPMTRNTLDLAGVAMLKELTHLPVIVDPSHATGRRSLVPACARAAVAVGADGLMLEAHPVPDQSVSDAAQAISLERLHALMGEIEPVAQAVGRNLHGEGSR